ncbi:MAG: exosortase-associated EpsI family protein [Planctomycetaceae bacterium]
MANSSSNQTATASQNSRAWWALITLVVVSTIGQLSLRSVASVADREEQIQRAMAAVERLPEDFGDWQLTELAPLDESAQRMLQCRAHSHGVYTNSVTGAKVSMVLLVGSAGPLVAHTPEICYSSTDNEIVESPQADAIRGSGTTADALYRIKFRSKDVYGGLQKVYYGWRRSDSPWQAPDNPRLSLGGAPFLYKLQVAAHQSEASAATSEESLPDDPARKFVIDVLPVLDEILPR